MSFIPNLTGMVGANVSLGSPANPQPAQAPVQIQLQAVQNVNRVWLGRPLSDGTYCYRQLTAEQERRIGTARDSLGDQLIQLRLIPAGSTGFEIPLGDVGKCVTYIDAHGAQHSIDLKELIDDHPQSEVARQYKEVVDVASEAWGLPIATNRSNVTALQESNNSCIEDLRKKEFVDTATDVLELYEKYEESGANGRSGVTENQVLRRMVAAEHVIRWHEKSLADLRTRIAGFPPGSPQLLQLQQQMAQLLKMKMERYAVDVALAFFPPTPNPTVAEVSRAATEALRSLEDKVEADRKKANDVHHKVTNRVSRFFHWESAPKDIEKDNKGCCADVVALMFSALPPTFEARSAYENFCIRNSVPTKARCSSDSLVQTIIQSERLPAGHNLFDTLRHAIEQITDVGLKGECRGFLTAYDMDGLRARLLTASRANPAALDVRGCLKALQDLFEIGRTVNGVTDPAVKQQCWRELEAALTSASRDLHPADPTTSIPPTFGPIPPRGNHPINNRVSYFANLYTFSNNPHPYPRA